MSGFSESSVEAAALAWMGAMGWQVAHGPNIALDMAAAERADYSEVVVEPRLRDGLGRLNPGLPAEAPEDAFRKLTRPRARI
jgi:type I restriction enzyme R subunit